MARSPQRLEIRLRDTAGRLRTFRIVAWKLGVVLCLPGVLLVMVGVLAGILIAPDDPGELDSRTAYLERENQDLRNRVAVLEMEVGLVSPEAMAQLPLPLPSLEAEPTITVAVKRASPSVTFEGTNLTLDGRTTRGAIEIRWTTEGMGLVGGRAVPNGAALEADGPVYITGGGPYPGRLLVYHEGAHVLVVNEVPLERYLEGVLSGELPASWDPEVKKAQAVAARSYALAQRARREGFHALESTTLDQVYKSGAIDARTTAAVAATRGEVLTQDGALVEAFYHATCAGHTEAAAYVWPERGVPFDWSTPCEYCKDSPLYSWEQVITIATLSEALRREQSGMGIVTGLTVLGRTPSGRARNIRLSTETGTVSLAGNDFRRILGYSKVRSTLFDVEEVDTGLRLSGRGAGHGVGLCQWGARGMIEAGFDYQQVLAHYYGGSSIRKLYE